MDQNILADPDPGSQNLADLDPDPKHWWEVFNSVFLNFIKFKFLPYCFFSVHYPDAIAKFGPLTGFWTGRFEARHRIGYL